MELLLSHDSCTNTELSSDGGRILYFITTPHTLKNLLWTRTVVSRRVLDAREPGVEADDIATIDWHTSKETQVTFRGDTMDIDTFLPKYESSRSFTGPDGRSYTWRTSRDTMRACHLDVESDKPATVATCRHEVNVITGKKPSLQVDDSVLNLLDLIVVTWIFVEKDRREEEAKSGGDA
ncbi:hypothetical protein PsYK624_041840 [Phanerochaete sordida]|uniref:DUF6593 domain-containing protein n=1 Tax=Phanerochaete sordida TaxID=48140 RepID=A0A9P3G4G0_9APHY|nr:hypothetical protein PsYK624_041840 [Phanerochaete sordida]